MKAYEIQLDDIGRLLFGGTPPTFLLEVVLRTAIVYLILMVSMRMMGKRMASELSRSELAALVSLAATVGIPLQDPDRGILPPLMIALIIVTLQRWMAIKVSNSESFENKIQGYIDILVNDGTLVLDAMKESRLSRERLFAQLRSNGIYHLGKIERFYFEANGSFSLIEAVPARPGLCIIPEWDVDLRNELNYDYEKWVCLNCGKMKAEDQTTSKGKCPSCDNDTWQRPVTGQL